MVLDVSGLGFFVPIFSFLFVFVVIFAILKKTELLGESAFINLLVSFVIATIFITVSSVRVYVESVIPWVAVLIIALLFVLLIIGLSQKKMEDMMKPGLGWIFIALLIVIFLVAAVNVFSPIFVPLLSGILASQRIVGGILILIIAAIAAWIITRK